MVTLLSDCTRDLLILFFLQFTARIVYSQTFQKLDVEMVGDFTPNLSIWDPKSFTGNGEIFLQNCLFYVFMDFCPEKLTVS